MCMQLLVTNKLVCGDWFPWMYKHPQLDSLYYNLSRRIASLSLILFIKVISVNARILFFFSLKVMDRGLAARYRCGTSHQLWHRAMLSRLHIATEVSIAPSRLQMPSQVVELRPGVRLCVSRNNNSRARLQGVGCPFISLWNVPSPHAPCLML